MLFRSECVASAAELFQHNCFSDVFCSCELYHNVHLSAFILGEAVFSGWHIPRTKKKQSLNKIQSSRGNDQSNEVLYIDGSEKRNVTATYASSPNAVSFIIYYF